MHEPVARAQLRWLTLGLGIGWGLGTIGSVVLNLVSGPSPYGGLWAQISAWLSLLLPISLAVAITRYRLFDIDIIIRRTLVYSTLSVVLALVYIGCIIVSRTLTAPLIGGSELAIVASTLAIAVLFNPLRLRIQNLIDNASIAASMTQQKSWRPSARLCVTRPTSTDSPASCCAW